MVVKKTLAGIVALALSGCAATPSAPPEPPLTVKLRGTAVEVQQYLEEQITTRSNGVASVDSATDRSITFKSNCMDMPNMGAFKCSLIMMAVGNSGWDGPFSMLTFRTAEIRGIVHLSVSSQWCATNAFGKTNCMAGDSNAAMNGLLRKVDQTYQRDVRPTASN